MASRAPPDGKEAPMDALFTLAGPEWSPPAEMGPLTSLAASHGSLFVSSAQGALLRLGVASAEYEPLEPPAAARGSPSHTLFVDPHTPSALLLSLPSGESHYFFKGKGRGLAKLKGIRLTAVAWARVEASRPEVRDVVLGDAKGVLYEASLEPARTRTFRQIHLLTPAAPVCGLHLEAFAAAGEEKRMLLLAATPSRLFEFVGGPTLDALVAEPPVVRHAAASPPAAAAAFAAHSLATHRRPNGAVASFACLCAGQVHFASLAAQPAQSSSLVVEFGSLPLPRVAPDGKDMADKSAAATVPTAMALTEFHFLLLYDSCLLAVSRLNHKVACRALPPRQWPSGARLLGLAHDASKGVLWAWGGAGVLRVRVHREERHVWRLHLEAARFAEALSYCSPTESMQRDAVLTAQAEHVFKEGQYELAATQYAKTKQTVEDVAMRFVAASQTAALKTYLLHKFDLVVESDVAQLTMLCTWLTEIYLRAMSAAPPPALAALRREFREFLSDKRRFLHRGTTHALIAAQGRAEEALHYAMLCADFERAIS
ncbi:hypothetical protein AB1Y20_016526 [Prymnesium parvum]|uniref:Pep3/Vps18 beta-propeller domain-containing protein n=1 Tax=Prymnesium parvum TaxID=97485 RepID=A0AB34IBV8_PRYPA